MEFNPQSNSPASGTNGILSNAEKPGTSDKEVPGSPVLDVSILDIPISNIPVTDAEAYRDYANALIPVFTGLLPPQGVPPAGMESKTESKAESKKVSDVTEQVSASAKDYEKYREHLLLVRRCVVDSFAKQGEIPERIKKEAAKLFPKAGLAQNLRILELIEEDDKEGPLNAPFTKDMKNVLQIYKLVGQNQNAFKLELSNYKFGTQLTSQERDIVNDAIHYTHRDHFSNGFDRNTLAIELDLTQHQLDEIERRYNATVITPDTDWKPILAVGGTGLAGIATALAVRAVAQRVRRAPNEDRGTDTNPGARPTVDAGPVIDSALPSTDDVIALPDLVDTSTGDVRPVPEPASTPTDVSDENNVATRGNGVVGRARDIARSLVNNVNSWTGVTVDRLRGALAQARTRAAEGSAQARPNRPTDAGANGDSSGSSPAEKFVLTEKQAWRVRNAIFIHLINDKRTFTESDHAYIEKYAASQIANLHGDPADEKIIVDYLHHLRDKVKSGVTPVDFFLSAMGDHIHQDDKEALEHLRLIVNAGRSSLRSDGTATDGPDRVTVYHPIDPPVRAEAQPPEVVIDVKGATVHPELLPPTTKPADPRTGSQADAAKPIVTQPPASDSGLGLGDLTLDFDVPLLEGDLSRNSSVVTPAPPDGPVQTTTPAKPSQGSSPEGESSQPGGSGINLARPSDSGIDGIFMKWMREESAQAERWVQNILNQQIEDSVVAGYIPGTIDDSSVRANLQATLLQTSSWVDSPDSNFYISDERVRDLVKERIDQIRNDLDGLSLADALQNNGLALQTEDGIVFVVPRVTNNSAANHQSQPAVNGDRDSHQTGPGDTTTDTDVFDTTPQPDDTAEIEKGVRDVLDRAIEDHSFVQGSQYQYADAELTEHLQRCISTVCSRLDKPSSYVRIEDERIRGLVIIRMEQIQHDLNQMSLAEVLQNNGLELSPWGDVIPSVVPIGAHPNASTHANPVQPTGNPADGHTGQAQPVPGSSVDRVNEPPTSTSPESIPVEPDRSTVTLDANFRRVVRDAASNGPKELIRLFEGAVEAEYERLRKSEQGKKNSDQQNMAEATASQSKIFKGLFNQMSTSRGGTTRVARENGTDPDLLDEKEKSKCNQIINQQVVAINSEMRNSTTETHEGAKPSENSGGADNRTITPDGNPPVESDPVSDAADPQTEDQKAELAAQAKMESTIANLLANGQHRGIPMNSIEGWTALDLYLDNPYVQESCIGEHPSEVLKRAWDTFKSDVSAKARTEIAKLHADPDAVIIPPAEFLASLIEPNGQRMEDFRTDSLVYLGKIHDDLNSNNPDAYKKAGELLRQYLQDNETLFTPEQATEITKQIIDPLLRSGVEGANPIESVRDFIDRAAATPIRDIVELQRNISSGDRQRMYEIHYRRQYALESGRQGNVNSSDKDKFEELRREIDVEMSNCLEKPGDPIGPDNQFNNKRPNQSEHYYALRSIHNDLSKAIGADPSSWGLPARTVQDVLLAEKAGAPKDNYIVALRGTEHGQFAVLRFGLGTEGSVTEVQMIDPRTGEVIRDGHTGKVISLGLEAFRDHLASSASPDDARAMKTETSADMGPLFTDLSSGLSPEKALENAADRAARPGEKGGGSMLGKMALIKAVFSIAGIGGTLFAGSKTQAAEPVKQETPPILEDGVNTKTTKPKAK